MTRLSVVRTAVLLALAFAAGGLALSDSRSAATSSALHAQTFIDVDTGFAIGVQLDQAAADAGHWTFRVPSRGTYVADARAGLRILSPSSADLDYEGVATLRASTGSSTTQVRLHAHIDPTHHTAEATLWDGQERFHLVARAVSTQGIGDTMDAVETAFTANDPVALYPLLNAQLARAYDSAAFASRWSTESATLGRVTALRRTSVGSPQATDQGFWYVVVEYSADVVTPSGPGTAAFTAFFIREPSGWKFWTSIRR